MIRAIILVAFTEKRLTSVMRHGHASWMPHPPSLPSWPAYFAWSVGAALGSAWKLKPALLGRNRAEGQRFSFLTESCGLPLRHSTLRKAKRSLGGLDTYIRVARGTAVIVNRSAVCCALCSALDGALCRLPTVTVVFQRSFFVLQRSFVTFQRP